MEKVTSKELQRRFGEVRSKALQTGVIVTHHGRDDLAIVPADEYQRLKALDTRQVLYPHELSDDLKGELKKGYQGEPTPDLDHLMD